MLWVYLNSKLNRIINLSFLQADFRRTIEEYDEKQFLTLRLVLAELRNHYASIHDIVTKNIEKIKTPRHSNSQSMY